MSNPKKSGLPVDFKAVRKLFKGTAEIAERPVRLYLYIDESIDPGLLRQAKAMFRPLDEKLEISLQGYYGRPLPLDPVIAAWGDVPDSRTQKHPGNSGAELAVILAADSPLSYELFWALSESRPTLVLSRRPAVFLRSLRSATGGLGQHFEKALRCLVTLPLEAPGGAGWAFAGEAPGDAGDLPAPTDDGYYQRLFAELGRVAAGELREGAVAWARSLEFLRAPVAAALVNKYALLNGALALLDFLPPVGLPLYLMNQMRMLTQLAAAYGLEMNAQRYIELAAGLGLGFLFRTLARRLTRVWPAAAWVVKAGVAGGGTYAMGRLARPYLQKAGQGLETGQWADLVQKAQQTIRQKLPARQSAADGQVAEADL